MYVLEVYILMTQRLIDVQPIKLVKNLKKLKMHAADYCAKHVSLFDHFEDIPTSRCLSKEN